MLYYRGERGELSFGADEIIELSRWVDSSWLEGRRGGETGLVPASFLQIVVSPEQPLHLATTGVAVETAGQEDGIGLVLLSIPKMASLGKWTSATMEIENFQFVE